MSVFRKMADDVAARGCIVNPPASMEDIIRLKSLLNLTNEENPIISMYRQFNGFSQPDPLSLVEIWTVQKILSFQPSYEKPEELVAFSDIMFDAEIFHVSVMPEPWIVNISGTKVASNIEEFINLILTNAVPL